MAIIRVSGYFKVDKDVANFKNDFEAHRQQIERDALVGTYEDFDGSIFQSDEKFKEFNARAQGLARCYDDQSNEETERGVFRFRLELDATPFSEPSYGLQRLIHTLASDMFVRHVSEKRAIVTIEDIDLHQIQEAIQSEYRPYSHMREAIRQSFAIGDNSPLLAFSMKPRLGLTDSDYMRLASDAFEGGCHIVEFDTRDCTLHGESRSHLIENLSKLAIKLSSNRICRFSANLSGPWRVVEPLVSALASLHAEKAPGGPFLVKIDGDLDGLSTIQGIRALKESIKIQPIITCYPVIKYALQQALGPNALVKMLSMSGADIIYPGQSPNFGAMGRRIDTGGVGRAHSHYQAMDMGGYPMLSVAGGISVNAVHACMSVLGSEIAFFVGGGIATSKKGILEGALNFSKAIDLSRRDLFENEEIKRLEGQFVDLSKIYFHGEIPENYEFVHPKQLKGVAGRHKSKNLED